MAIMEAKEMVNLGQNVSMSAGEYISIRILNPDGSLKTTIYEACVPTGKVAACMTSFYATIADA